MIELETTRQKQPVAPASWGWTYLMCPPDRYDVVYSIVTVKDGAPVDSANTAYALANCNACTTVAVSFQLWRSRTDSAVPIAVMDRLVGSGEGATAGSGRRVWRRAS